MGRRRSALRGARDGWVVSAIPGSATATSSTTANSAKAASGGDGGRRQTEAPVPRASRQMNEAYWDSMAKKRKYNEEIYSSADDSANRSELIARAPPFGRRASLHRPAL